MRRQFSSIILVFVTCWAICDIFSPCSAQITFERIYGGSSEDRGYSVQQARGGGYIVAGCTQCYTDFSDVYLVRADSLGDTLWSKTFGGSKWDDGYSVQQTQDGGFVIAGLTRSFGAGSADVYLVRTDSLGEVVWESTYGRPSADFAYSVRPCSDGGYIIVGGTYSSSSDSCDLYLIKSDSLGTLLWEGIYAGGSSECGYSVQQSSDGGYIAAGCRDCWTDSSDVYLLKTDSLGNTLWENTHGGSQEDHAYSVQQTADGGYIVVGKTDVPIGDSCHVYLVRTDASGTAVWEKTIGRSSYDAGIAVDLTSDSGYLITGVTYSSAAGNYDMYLIKTDSLGDTLWTRTFGGSNYDNGRSVQQTQDGGYIVTGWSGSFGAGQGDIYLVKTDKDGEVGVTEEGPRRRVDPKNPFLLQNSPNPFHHLTLISYSLPHASEVTLAIYDIAGRLVESLVSEIRQPGTHQVRWNRETNPSGVYFYRFEAGEFTETKKMVVVE